MCARAWKCEVTARPGGPGRHTAICWAVSRLERAAAATSASAVSTAQQGGVVHRETAHAHLYPCHSCSPDASYPVLPSPALPSPLLPSPPNFCPPLPSPTLPFPPDAAPTIGPTPCPPSLPALLDPLPARQHQLPPRTKVQGMNVVNDVPVVVTAAGATPTAALVPPARAL